MSSTRRDAPHSPGVPERLSKRFPPSGAGELHRAADMRSDASGSLADRGRFDVRGLAGESDPDPDSFLSVVVPAKNEALCIPQLIAEIAQALRPLCVDSEACSRQLGGFEIVLVDDGSTDATRLVLEQLRDQYPELAPLHLAWNVGQSAAIAAGFRVARGDWVATLDADLQNDPADLAALWNVLPGHDAALGWRVKRRDVWSKRLISRWANRARNWVLGQAIRDTGCSVRIFRRSMALRLPMFRGAHRFLGPLLLREGCRLIQIPVNHRARPHGVSHYNFRNRSFKVVVDLLGVAWLMRRPTRYEVLAVPDRPGSSSLPSSQRAMNAHSTTFPDAMAYASRSSTSADKEADA